MNCDEARRHWSLYHDSEGDSESHFRIGEHLAMCDQCARWFDQQSRLENLLANNLRSQSLTPSVWDAVLNQPGLVPKQRAVLHRWKQMLGVAACLLLITAAWWISQRHKSSVEPDLAIITSLWHQRLAAGEETLQFRSDSDLAVEDYLRKQVSFPVRCPPRRDAGFAIQGAGVLRLADQPAAYLSGHVGEASVSIFVLPSDSLAAFPHQQQALRKETIHHRWEGDYAMVMGVIDKNAVLVIGQAEPQRLEKVLNAYGTYPDHP